MWKSPITALIMPRTILILYGTLPLKLSKMKNIREKSYLETYDHKNLSTFVIELLERNESKTEGWKKYHMVCSRKGST